MNPVWRTMYKKTGNSTVSENTSDVNSDVKLTQISKRVSYTSLEQKAVSVRLSDVQDKIMLI